MKIYDGDSGSVGDFLGDYVPPLGAEARRDVLAYWHRGGGPPEGIAKGQSGKGGIVLDRILLDAATEWVKPGEDKTNTSK